MSSKPRPPRISKKRLEIQPGDIVVMRATRKSVVRVKMPPEVELKIVKKPKGVG
jgi:signal peptidase I